MSVALFSLRVAWTGGLSFWFLNWNLFLAWIPLACAAGAVALQGPTREPRLGVIPLLAIWLLFFPNAPYILTDLLHLAPRQGVPLWFDLLMLLSFAWNGLILGFASLWIVQGLVRRWYGWIAGWAAAAICLFAAAAGIYLGRFERWNSWDLIVQPAPLLRSIAHGLLDPTQHLKAIVIVVLLAAILGMMYLTLALFAGNRQITIDN